MDIGPAEEIPERKELLLPTDVKGMVLIGILALMTLNALYFTGEILIPIIIAFLLKMLLEPVMEFLVAWHLPRFLSAFLIVSVLLSGFTGLAVILSGPAASWISKAPESFTRLQTRLAGLTAVARDFQKASHDVEKIGEDSTSPAVAVKGPALSTFLFSGTRALSAGLITVVVLLYFLLVSGNSFLRRIVEILPTLQNKKQAVDITNEIQLTVATYLGTVTVMNALVGLLTGVAAYFCGLSDPILWGSVAFLLNYIPIIGPLAGVAMLGLAGGHILGHPRGRRRGSHADTARASTHAQSGCGDHRPRLLVLDVGRRRSAARRADARDVQDHLRPNQTPDGDRALSRHGSAGNGKRIFLGVFEGPTLVLTSSA
jgi:predicted PurR-regulated permease PerM